MILLLMMAVVGFFAMALCVVVIASQEAPELARHPAIAVHTTRAAVHADHDPTHDAPPALAA